MQLPWFGVASLRRPFESSFVIRGAARLRLPRSGYGGAQSSYGMRAAFEYAVRGRTPGFVAMSEVLGMASR